MKACPLCAEMIQDEAIKCWHCGGWLNKEEEAKHAGTPADSAKFGIVKLYSYLLMGGGALGLLVSIAAVTLLKGPEPSPSGAPGAPELVFFLPIAAIYGALILLAFGLLKRKRIAFVLNMVVLAIGLVAGILAFALPGSQGPLRPIPRSSASTSVVLLIWSGAWMAYFFGKKRLFPR